MALTKADPRGKYSVSIAVSMASAPPAYAKYLTPRDAERGLFVC